MEDLCLDRWREVSLVDSKWRTDECKTYVWIDGVKVAWLTVSGERMRGRPKFGWMA